MHVLGRNIKYISYQWDESLRKSPDNLKKVQENPVWGQEMPRLSL